MSTGQMKASTVYLVGRCSTMAAQRGTRLRLLPAAIRARHILHHFLLHKKALFAAGLPVHGCFLPDPCNTGNHFFRWFFFSPPRCKLTALTALAPPRLTQRSLFSRADPLRKA